MRGSRTSPGGASHSTDGKPRPGASSRHCRRHPLAPGGAANTAGARATIPCPCPLPRAPALTPSRMLACTRTLGDGAVGSCKYSRPRAPTQLTACVPGYLGSGGDGLQWPWLGWGVGTSRPGFTWPLQGRGGGLQSPPARKPSPRGAGQTLALGFPCSLGGSARGRGSRKPLATEPPGHAGAWGRGAAAGAGRASHGD